jgi:hypothetical protein
MKILYWVLGLLLGVPLLFFIVMFGASELGGEVVTLERPEANGESSQIRVWIVDHEDIALVEHGDPDSYWIDRLGTSNDVILTRDGETLTYVGTPDPDAHDLYHELRREKYGWADQLIGYLGGGDENCQGIPVRLRVSDDV